MTIIKQFDGVGLDDLPKVTEEALAMGKDLNVWLLLGQMGAGKTTLSKLLAKELGVEDNVQSPTFSIVNEYRTREDIPVYHFDFYRLKDLQEAVAIGVEEYFFSGHRCLVEWPQVVEELLPDEFLRIDIEPSIDGKRHIKLTQYG